MSAEHQKAADESKKKAADESKKKAADESARAAAAGDGEDDEDPEGDRIDDATHAGKLLREHPKRGKLLVRHIVNPTGRVVPLRLDNVTDEGHYRDVMDAQKPKNVKASAWYRDATQAEAEAYCKQHGLKLYSKDEEPAKPAKK